MTTNPAFLDSARPDVPDIVVPRGITPFYLPGRPVRGRLVRLGPLADALLTRHQNHPVVTALTGQALALTAALATALKFRGSFSLQAKGDGALPMLLADCTESGALRGYARADADKLATLLAAEENPSAAALLGHGYLAFSVDQGPDRERHQGIVSIEGDTLADMALHYFETSEQLRCTVRLACAKTPLGWRAGALILERVAREGGLDAEMDEDAQAESWRTATALAATLKESELLDDTLQPDRLAVQPVRDGGRGRRPQPRPRLWLPLLPRTLIGHPGDLSQGRPGPHGSGRRHRHGRASSATWTSGSGATRCMARRRAGRMLRRAALLLPLLLVACGGDDLPPRADFPALHYDYLTPLRLNVGAVDVVDAPAPGPLDGVNPAPPGQALRRMALGPDRRGRQHGPGGVRH